MQEDLGVKYFNDRYILKIFTISLRTKAELKKKPVIGTQIGNIIVSGGNGLRSLIHHSARFKIEKTVNIITDVVSAGEAKRPTSASISTITVATAVAIRGVRVR